MEHQGEVPVVAVVQGKDRPPGEARNCVAEPHTVIGIGNAEPADAELKPLVGLEVEVRVQQVEAAEPLVDRDVVLDRLGQMAVEDQPHPRDVEAGLVDRIGMRIAIGPDVELRLVVELQFILPVAGLPPEAFVEDPPQRLGIGLAGHGLVAADVGRLRVQSRGTCPVPGDRSLPAAGAASICSRRRAFSPLDRKDFLRELAIRGLQTIQSFDDIRHGRIRHCRIRHGRRRFERLLGGRDADEAQAEDRGPEPG